MINPTATKTVLSLVLVAALVLAAVSISGVNALFTDTSSVSSNTFATRSKFPLLAKTGTFVADGGVGNQAITGVGFQPKAVFFWMTDHTSEGNRANSRFGRGWTDGTNQGAAATAWQDGSNTVQDRIVSTATITLINEAGTLLGEAGISSFDSDGFTLDWTTDGGSRIVQYLALGGAALTDVYAGSKNLSAATEAITGVGFQPDVVFLAGIDQSSFGNSGRGGHAFGVGLSATSRHTSSHRERSTGNGTSGLTETQALVPADDTTTPEVRYDLQSMDADGFTLVKDVDSAGHSVATIYLALKGADVARGTITQPTTAGNQSVGGLSFNPVVVVFDGGDKATVNGWQAEPEAVHGVATSSAQRSATWIGRNGTSADTSLTTAAVVRSLTAGTPTTNAEADFVSMNSDGFTINWTTVDTTARIIGWVALGPN